MPPPPPSSARPPPAPGASPAPSGEGPRLDALLERSARTWTPLSEALCCHVVAEAASRLAAAPPNAQGPRPLTPFHLRLTPHGGVELEGLGAPGAGHLAYAAPEQVRAGAPVDGARAEVFSLGVLLVQLLTGQHLFPGAERFEAEVRRAAGREDAALAACARELEGCLRAYGPARLEAATRAVSVELRPLVHRALAEPPAARYPDGAALAHALREHLRHTEQPFGPARLRAELAALGL